MELKELAQRLGVNTYPEALENVYKNLDTSDELICDEAFITALHEKYDLFGEYYDVVMAGARDLKEKEDLLTWGKLAYAYCKDATRHEASLMPMPPSDGSPAGDMLPVLALTREVPEVAKRYADRGFSEAQIKKNLENIRINMWVNQLAKGRISLYQGLYSWLAYYTKALIFDHKGFNYQPTGWPPRAKVLKNKKSGEYVILMEDGRFTKDGLVLGSAGATDESGAFEAAFAEDEDAFYGCVSEGGYVLPTRKRFEKTEWEVVLQYGDYVVNLHIPRNTCLDPAYITESFKEGLALAKKHYPELAPKCIVCTSWLIDPQLVKILGPDAKLSGFNGRFLKHPIKDPTGTGCIGFIWPGESGPVSEYSEKTSLQRGVKKLMLEGDFIRTTTGVLVDDL